MKNENRPARPARPTEKTRPRAPKPQPRPAPTDEAALVPPLWNYDVYRPSGRCGLAGFIGLPLWTFAVGTVLAWIQAWINYSGPIVSGERLLVSTLAGGLISGWLGLKAVRVLKIRSPRLTLFLAAVGLLAGWLASWPAIHYFSGSSMDLAAFVNRRLWDGLVVKLNLPALSGQAEGADYRLFKGVHLAACWFLEAGFLALCGGRIAAVQAGRPFSEASRRWYRYDRLRAVEPNPDDLAALADLPHYMIPDFLANLENFKLCRRPKLFPGRRILITVIEDPDWLKPFINLRAPGKFLRPRKLRHYRVTLEEADLMAAKFKM